MTSTRRQFLTTTGALPAFLLSVGAQRSMAQANRPNILWILAEDLSPDLGCYGESLAQTPNIDRLASEGVRFTNAFTTAPVCSAARSALHTGMYQTSIGAHNHRSHRQDGYRLPDGVRLITDYFRDVGYFTANIKRITNTLKGAGKTDFNFKVEKPFDGDDWDQLKSSQPFFAEINFPEAHRKFKKLDENPTDPADVVLPPYYPDHPITREDWALYLDTIGHLDRKVGAVLKKLEDDGLTENTIVVLMGDHGRCHVRGKQWLYDGGIHIPLIARWPGEIEPGTVRDDMISSIDVAATSLVLAGVDISKTKMEGRFVGPNEAAREYIVAARDRCDETVDRIRCVRDKRFKYIRNFHPERPYTQLNRYKETSYPVLRLMRRLYKQGKLTPEQARFMAPARPMEELYDLSNDPHEVHNLAVDPNYAGTLQLMRDRLQHWIEETGDQGEIPEDLSIVDRYNQSMTETYYKKLKELYEKEGMEWIW